MCYLFKDSGKFPGEDGFVDHLVGTLLMCQNYCLVFDLLVMNS